jgi:peroxiredoxin family protein
MADNHMGKSGPDKLSLVVFSSAFDKIHYALVMASAAQATNRQATLFFTMGACRALLKKAPNGEFPWQKMSLSARVNLTEVGQDGGQRNDHFQNVGVGEFEELLGACVELGVSFMVCEMGLRAEGIARSDLREDVPLEEGGFVTFLNDASKDGTVLFI